MKRYYSVEMMGKAVYKRVVAVSLVLVGLLFCIGEASAQLMPMGAQYYHNQYLGNPAFVGTDEGLNLFLSHRNAFTGMPGNPVSQVLTVAYQKEQAGFGLTASNDKSGFFKRSRIVGTYAYHLPLDDDEQELHFGISLGFMSEQIDNSLVIGTVDDELVARFNERQTYVDGDFGMVYTNGNITLQAAIPNLNKFLKKEVYSAVDRSTFLTAVSYKVPAHQDALLIEPKLTYRGVKGFNYFWDFGTNVQFANNQFNVMATYHSNKAATFGLGLTYREMFIQGLYTYQLAEAQPYVNGNFEINLSVSLFKNKKVIVEETIEEQDESTDY
ncbi:PorP/SprF family type IX secretion system membrane protein [Pontibacter silvestris]|uniref:PorP/SprF family type IX secretion system membrane protein n=1 Tax=Pontibacter silvestris TaxID=2305183 RepID=A0ABW4X0B4_9BACT|nr:PorP/SprF family type IX secretion system membrane protein [Pontibacter silvestris]MCC9138726.1 PorP/SprF family type IX secretion system membrane protein [Pontibacter silvestris]